ncbi:hypothetical protein [Duganella vulcania]|uniref:Uncharacterized protein n=1 Tax=Duganella vulcania TaxID=2692166 RepID=A0A845GGX2_9BURK|nr:hypothetical protein [Duganella vulcania]MYM92672.1 hypothetical protein [Duganella vulcania]
MKIEVGWPYQMKGSLFDEVLEGPHKRCKSLVGVAMRLSVAELQHLVEECKRAHLHWFLLEKKKGAPPEMDSCASWVE